MCVNFVLIHSFHGGVSQGACGGQEALWESLIFFHNMGSRDQTHVVRLGDKAPLLTEATP